MGWGQVRAGKHYDRARLVTVLIYHQRRSIGGCACGWNRLGHSHAEHVADVYEMVLAEQTP